MEPDAAAEPSRPSPAAVLRPDVPGHRLVRLIAQGSYGDVWLAQNVIGTWRAVKVVHRGRFEDARPFHREFEGICAFEPVSRTHEGLIDIL